jgi:hypothetical protein
MVMKGGSESKIEGPKEQDSKTIGFNGFRLNSLSG